MKKEVSDHLARVFIEARVPETKTIQKPREKSFFFFMGVSAVVVTALVFGIGFFSASGTRQARAAAHVVAIEKHDGPYTLKFNFTDAPSKIEVLSIALGGMDLKGFDRMRFAIRINDAQAKNIGSIKASLTNARRESSSIYLPELSSSWKTVELSLQDFSYIHDWTCLERLSFSLEAWNLGPRTGELMIDGVEFIKN